VLKAYHDLEQEGLLASRHGVGTFVRRTVAVRPRSEHDALRRRLERWLEDARGAGLREEEIEALIAVTRHETAAEEGIA
jgi:GntR family transcriptional regulator